jgi:hypothetical protein
MMPTELYAGLNKLLADFTVLSGLRAPPTRRIFAKRKEKVPFTMFGLSFLKPRTEGKAPAAWGTNPLVGEVLDCEQPVLNIQILLDLPKNTAESIGVIVSLMCISYNFY